MWYVIVTFTAHIGLSSTLLRVSVLLIGVHSCWHTTGGTVATDGNGDSGTTAQLLVLFCTKLLPQTGSHSLQLLHVDTLAVIDSLILGMLARGRSLCLA